MRVRRAVLHRADHVGYVTVTTYPGRDLTAFTEGSPYSEVVVADLKERHVALFQRYKEHWLIHCGTDYVTTAAAGELAEPHVSELAVFALRHRDFPPAVLVAVLKAHVERLLAPEVGTEQPHDQRRKRHD